VRPFARAALVALVAVGAACAPRGAGGQPESHALLGAPAPPFELAAESGGARVASADLAGLPAIVDFWATWCEPCRESFPLYQRISEENAGRLAVVAISVDERPDGIRRFAEETGARFPIAWDEGGHVARRWQPPGMPTSFFLDRHGIVRALHVGFRAGDEPVVRGHVAEISR
jgi:thiol-disulfide isomerase/thioredoxin